MLYYITKWLEALKTIVHFKIPLYSLPLLQSTIVMKHKALRYRLICSVDHVIGQAIFIFFRVGGRVGKDTKRRLIGKNVELTIQNVWNSTLWQRSIGKIFCITTGWRVTQSEFPYGKFSLWTCAEVASSKLRCNKPTELRPLIYQVVNFYLGFGLRGGGQGD